jgi:hypothetical protein
MVVVLLGFAGPVYAQEDLTVEQLETQYRIALGADQVARQEKEFLSSQFDDAVVALDSARAAGDQARQNQAFTLFQRLSRQLTSQDRRLEATEAEKREVRGRLLDALRARWDARLAQADSTQDPTKRQDLYNSVRDTENRVRDLRAEEDLVVTVEPVPNIVIRPTDDTTTVRAKANALDFLAEASERQLAYTDQLLEELRLEQALQRRSADFRNDVERYGDTRLPVGPPVIRTLENPDPAQRPLTADSVGGAPAYLPPEERIAALEALQVRLAARIEDIRAQAERFRRRAGGVWA